MATSHSRQFPLVEPRTIIGRSSTADLTLFDASVSGIHAEILRIEGNLYIRDLHSTNGTFVNGAPIRATTLLREGDVIRFAHVVFRVDAADATPPETPTCEEDAEFAHRLLQFDYLIHQEAIRPHYQPIVHLKDGSMHGYELLARSPVEGLENPAAMFEIAAKIGQETQLSELARKIGVGRIHMLGSNNELFVNTHPNEIVTNELLESLRTMRHLAPTALLTVEIHEAAVTNGDAMQRLKLLLDSLDIKIAYDDFGAGKARLTELTDFAPDYVKFDMGLIRNIDQASSARQSLVESLVKLVNELGVTSLAEGVETEAETNVCRAMGFHLAQGYYFGRPAPL